VLPLRHFSYLANDDDKTLGNNNFNKEEKPHWKQQL
jgi:hypothetical protein